MRQKIFTYQGLRYAVSFSRRYRGTDTYRVARCENGTSVDVKVCDGRYEGTYGMDQVQAEALVNMFLDSEHEEYKEWCKRVSFEIPEESKPKEHATHPVSALA